MRLGLCCMLHTTKMKKGFVGINALKTNTNPFTKLIEASIHNLDETKKCIEWVIKNQTGMFRFSSDMIPFGELWDWQDNPIIKYKMNIIKKLVLENNIRTTIHPSQFCVINSENPNVVKNSISILKHHEQLCNMLSIDNIIIHTGSAKNHFKERFLDGFLQLPTNVKKLIRLENCHNVNILDVLDICYACNIKPILDIHHNRICGNVEITKHLIDEICAFWQNVKPIGHISSGKNKLNDRAHNDYITKKDFTQFKYLFDIFDFEIEAKSKDLAIIKIKKGGLNVIY